MKCPYCGHEEDKVLESRLSSDKNSIRRRRQCLECSGRFTSYERVEERPLMVVKVDGRREPFSREKILGGISKACEKRPISMEAIDEIVDEIERDIRSSNPREVLSNIVGELIMKKLQKLDQVAYVRFASVYRQFKDASDFVREIKGLGETKCI
jgi:transcriptional repressor NrdR